MKGIVISFCFIISIVVIPFAQSESVEDTTYFIQDSVYIPTKSGVDIYALIATKRRQSSPLPVVLFYTTYYQGEGDAIFAKLSADRGYVGIVAYARGIRTDAKEYFPYEHEASDIYDIIDWISKQEWCNGKVGMYGGSYTGFSQWSAVKNVHPALKTIVPQVAVMPGFDFPMQNNVPLGFELNWSHTNVYSNDPITGGLRWEWYEKGYAYSRMDSALGYSNVHFQKWLEHPAYDDYWSSMVPTNEEYASLDIPVLTTTGYFDGPQISAVEYFRLHNKHNPNADHYLVIGPYDHWGGQRDPAPVLRGYEIDSVAHISMRTLAYDWLDWILKDGPKPELLEDKANFQVMGTNTWQHEPTIEALSNRTLRLYLNDHSLDDLRPDEVSLRTQTIDFKDRDGMNNFFHFPLIIDSLDASNGLVFISDPFEEDIIINGAFTGELTLETNKRDLDISISFYEQMEDGSYFMLSRYLGRASYAKDNTARALLTPGKKERIPLRASHIVSKKIGAQSRFVIVVNVNKHPFEIINYGSGKEPAHETIRDAGEPMVIKWMNDSYIEIPVWKK